MLLKAKKRIAREFIFLTISGALIGLVYVYCLLSNMYYAGKVKEDTIEINTLRVESGGLMKTYNDKKERRKEFYKDFRLYFKHGDIFGVDKNNLSSDYHKFITEFGREQFEIRRKLLATTDKLQKVKLQEKLWGDPFFRYFGPEKNEYHYYEEALWKDILRFYNNESIEQSWNSTWVPEVIDFFNANGYASPQALQGFLKSSIINESDVDGVSRYKALAATIGQKDAQLNKKKARIYSKDKITGIMSNSSIIILGLLFLGRYFYYALRWSIKALKTPS